MPEEMKDVAHEPTGPLFPPGYTDMADYDPMNIAGPGGRSTNTENNEKGILESGLFRVLSHHTEAALGSDHDTYSQGIYSSGISATYGD